MSRYINHSKRELNSEVLKFYKQSIKMKSMTKEQGYDSVRERLVSDLSCLHGTKDIYLQLSNLNALRMASMCSTYRFAPPFRMLSRLQQNVEQTTSLINRD